MEQIERTEKQRTAASARNALPHGLCARTLSLANEDPEMLTTLLNDLTAEFQPHTPARRLLIVEMAQAKRKGIDRAIRHYSRNSRRRYRCARVAQKWHQYRIWLSETSHLNQKMAETAAAVADTFETFDESVRTAIAIDGRCNRQLHGASHTLFNLTKTSKNERTNLRREAQRDRLGDPSILSRRQVRRTSVRPT